MNTYVIFRRNGWPSGKELDEAAARSHQVGADMAADVKWIRSYILGEEDGTLGSVCVYQATSEDKLREHADCAGLPVSQILPVVDTVLVNPDP